MAKKTKGERKSINYFEEVVRTEKFKEEMSRIRNKYNIPSNGFDWDKIGGAVMQIPNEWMPVYDDQKDLFDKEITELCEKFHLFGQHWEAVIWEYAIWNEMLNLEFDPIDMCILEDENYKIHFRQEGLNKMYPVALRINPYASIREIISFLNANSFRIKHLQKESTDSNMRLGKSRTKRFQKRNDLIYKNDNLPIKKIGGLVKKEFGEILDDGHIGKIKSIEKKKRN